MMKLWTQAQRFGALAVLVFAPGLLMAQPEEDSATADLPEAEAVAPAVVDEDAVSPDEGAAAESEAFAIDDDGDYDGDEALEAGANTAAATDEASPVEAVMAIEDSSDEDDDDWDTAGPVDRTPRISGVLSASYRGTLRAGDTLPDGSAVENEHTFQIEHTHVKLSGDLSEKLSWELMPCLTHMNDFSVMTANLEYEIVPAFRVTAGRFFLPFGQFNLRALPGSFDTISRPMLYSSHEDRAISIQGFTPKNFIFTPRDDTGLQVSGSVWAGDSIQLSYNAYVTNGLRNVSDTMARFWDDNNNGKQLGGRISASYNGASFTAAAGGSFLANQYADDPNALPGEQALNQRAWAADAHLAYAYAEGKRITLRGEYVDMVREIIPTTEILQGDEGVSGAYVTLTADITGSLALFYQFDTLTQRTPVAQQNEVFRDRIVTATRHVGGLSYAVTGGWMLRLEYGRWNLPSGIPDADRLSIQTILTF